MQEADLPPFWNKRKTKQAILQFVADETTEGGPYYVPSESRIATFDSDGTLWVKYPVYSQALFAFDRVKRLAPQYPEWKTQQPFKALMEGDMDTVGTSGMEGLMATVMATHTSITATEFAEEAGRWLRTTQHP